MKWIAAAILAVTAGQDVRDREIGLVWIWLFSLACAGGGGLMNVPGRICAVMPGIFLMVFHLVSPASVGDADVLMVWGMGFGFPADAVWEILVLAAASAAAAGVCRQSLRRETGEEGLPFLVFLLWAFLLRFPLL